VGDLAFPSGIGKIQRGVGMSETSNCRREPTCYLHDGKPSHQDKLQMVRTLAVHVLFQLP
jgi:hypothetical protein